MKTATELELSENIGVSIFDIKFLPDEFELPPDSLQAKVGKITGFDGSHIIWDKNRGNKNKNPCFCV